MDSYTYAIDSDNATKIHSAVIINLAKELKTTATKHYANSETVDVKFVKNSQPCECCDSCTDNAHMLLIRISEKCQRYQLYCSIRAKAMIKEFNLKN